MNPFEPSARLLFRAALALFTVTIVIGILNGMDIWQPSHNLLLTHVHAGTIGWITLAVIGAAMLMFGDRADARTVAAARQVAKAAIVTTVLYVGAFATTTGVIRPITGTLMLVAIIWALVWTWGRFSSSGKSTAQLGILLAMISLAIGAVLGVLLGLFIAGGSIPGLSNETAAAIAGAHPPSMLIGYLVLAGAAIVHWLLNGSQSIAGRIVMWALFVGGIVVNLAFILDIEALIQLATALEVVAIVTLIVHLFGKLKPDAWRGQGADNHARVAAVFLLVGIGLLVYVVQLFISGELNPETGEGSIGVLLAFDHAMFIGVMTNALLALIARVSAAGATRIALWAVNTGLVVFLLGLVLEVVILKQVGAPIMGLALLHAIFVHLRGLGSPRTAAT